MIKRIISIITIFTCLNLQFSPVYAAYLELPGFICEKGVRLYSEGRYDDALKEFNKALLVNPDYILALEYIDKIKKLHYGEYEYSEQAVPPPYARVEIIDDSLDRASAAAGASGVSSEPLRVASSLAVVSTVSAPAIEVGPRVKMPPVIEEEAVYPHILLNEIAESGAQAIEIEYGKSLLIIGNNITRSLATYPDIIDAAQRNPDELLLTAKGVGYTDFHIWQEDKERKTLQILIIPVKLKGTSIGEGMLLEGERAESFKLSYSVDWYSYEQGKRIRSLNRTSYGYYHYLALDGPSPYGNLDTSLSVRSLRTTTDLTHLTLGLTRGTWGPFKDFSLRAMSFTPSIYNLSYGSSGLRGIKLSSPMFNKKINYTLFWGREGGGRYGNLSPGLYKLRNSFLSGFGLNYSPSGKQDYSFSVVHGWGRERGDYLNAYNYDLSGSWYFDKWHTRYEIANDSETFAHLFNMSYAAPNFSFRTEFRDTDRNFRSATSYGGRRGEIGGTISVSAQHTDRLSTSYSLDVFKDRLNFSPERKNRLNESFSWGANYKIDALTNLSLNYNLNNNLGQAAQSRYQSQGMSLSRTSNFLQKKIYSSLGYSHRESKSYPLHTSDSISDSIYTGLNFRLIGDIYYSANKNFSWLDQRSSAIHTMNESMGMGLSWSGKITSRDPLYGNIRFYYQTQENPASSSNIVVLSGQDYIEGYSELSYRPADGNEFYISGRVRNVWPADSASSSKGMEVDFRAGMRYKWDTGIRWETVRTIDGYVFNDYNADGLRSSGEPGILGVRVWLGKDKAQVTDYTGYYKFTKVKAKKVYISVDADTLPSGYMLTTSSTQEVLLTAGKLTKINFGIGNQSEIAGMVFEDTDEDSSLSATDIGVRGITLILDNEKKISTDTYGRYFFRNVPVGKHTITVDLDSIPTEYIPTVPLTQEIELFEGTSYNCNVPLKKVKK